MEMLQGVRKQHLRPRAVVGYGVKIFLPSPPNYVTRSPGYFKVVFFSSLSNAQKSVCMGIASGIAEKGTASVSAITLSEIL